MDASGSLETFIPSVETDTEDKTMSDEPMNPENTICVVKNQEGKEIGRIAATAPNASQYIEELMLHSGGGTVDYIEDADEAAASRLMQGMFRQRPW